MLKIHFGRENLNKEKYMFENIKRSAGKVLLLVPDQFTLMAEKEAFFYLETKGLMDVEVLSLSRLGSRILVETGGSNKARIDASGRYMLLTKIVSENKEKLRLFKNSSELVTFAEMANDIIYEMKQYNTTAADLLPLIESAEDDLILKQKLEDIHLLYSKYEEYTKEKYLDGEDYLTLFASKIEQSKFIKDCTIWVYGFDYFTPKNVEMLKELMKHSKEMNVLMTHDISENESDIFGLTGDVIRNLEKTADENVVSHQTIAIPETYSKWANDGNEAIAKIESGLFDISAETFENHEGISLVKAANLYSEIESAAAQVLELVREKELKYKDIAIICNDIEERGSIAKRVFAQYGITLFVDHKRSFMQNSAVQFIVSLLNIITHKYRNPDIFGMLKTAMTDIPACRYEELENYVKKYRIKGSRWKTTFQKGELEYGEALAELEQSRSEIIELVSKLEKPFLSAKTVRQKIEVLYKYLTEVALIPEKLVQVELLETEKGLHEFAEETAQTWKRIIDIFDQMVEIVGDENISAKNFAEVLTVGFESVEVGVLPPTTDGLILGTMQRMRTGKIKALLIIGANEGILPLANSKESLLSDDEKARLMETREICHREELRLNEEKLAIYKNMSRPEKFLWMSASVSDNEGNKLGTSFIFDKLSEMFSALEIQKDIISEAQSNGVAIPRLIQTEESTLLHVANILRECLTYEKQPDLAWQTVIDWYKKNHKESYEIMLDGLLFKSKEKALPEELVDDLYKKGRENLSISPSGLEKYGKCPFSFFVNYGINPTELRVFEMAGREIGDIYHNCIMHFSKALSENLRWYDITKEESDELIDRLIDEEAGNYREGVLSQGAEEIYRTSRIKTVCKENAWVLVQHVRSGNIKAMKFEERFGQFARREAENAHSKDIESLPPIEVETSTGKKVLIRGQIDRIDVLADGSVKIIDYKSGREQFRLDEVKAGVRLQLMLYLKAAQGQDAEPAGVFYFTIDENVESGRMDGIVVDKVSVIESIAGELEGKFPQRSSIIPIWKSKEGIIKGNTEQNLLSEEEFKELQVHVDKKVKALCSELTKGKINIKPKKTGKTTACTYCDYKSICTFDIAFDGFSYESV